MKHSLSIAIVIAPYHEKVSEKMLTAATIEAAERSLTVTSITTVPGCYEIPFIVSHLLKTQKLNGVVVLGMIERGQTLHGEVMGHAVVNALINLEITHKTPIGKGIIGPGATPAQGLVRAVSTARGAVAAVAAQIVNTRL